jgi:hypothetical protein
MNEETYYGIQANTVLLLAQIAVLLRMTHRLAEQNGLKVDGILPQDWFRQELQPALKLHLERFRLADPRGFELVYKQLLECGHFQYGQFDTE